jgi:hypothetical protein
MRPDAPAHFGARNRATRLGDGPVRCREGDAYPGQARALVAPRSPGLPLPPWLHVHLVPIRRQRRHLFTFIDEHSPLYTLRDPLAIAVDRVEASKSRYRGPGLASHRLATPASAAEE